MNIAYLGLGSNVGERESAIRTALGELDKADFRLLRLSSLYETEPVGFLEQGWFLNLAAEFEAEILPEELLRRIRKIEQDLGRERAVKDGPRTIDIDVLLYNSLVLKTEELEIPHPRYRERRFVLAPLAELAPELRDPETNRTASEMLALLRGQVVRRLPFERGIVPGVQVA